jgi:prepilin signal peptidase PulO-like enzyme (type II secretory pathway)
VVVIEILVFVFFGIYLSIYDYFTHLIQNSVLIKLSAAILVLMIIKLFTDPLFSKTASERIKVFLVIALFYSSLTVLSKFKVGAGDLKYALVISFFLVVALPLSKIVMANQIAILVAWSSAGLIAIGQWIFRRSQNAIPMAPALFLGAISALLTAFY